MNQFQCIAIWACLASAAWLVGCNKEVIDVTVTELEIPTPEEIASVDCPEFMLDMGDPCTIEDQAGLLSTDCECLDPSSVEVVVLDFVNDIGTDVVVTVETEPAFWAGKTYVVVPVEGVAKPYYFPLGTSVLSVSAFFACADFGVSDELVDHSNSPSIGGSTVQLHVDCP